MMIKGGFVPTLTDVGERFLTWWVPHTLIFLPRKAFEYFTTADHHNTPVSWQWWTVWLDAQTAALQSIVLSLQGSNAHRTGSNTAPRDSRSQGK